MVNLKQNMHERGPSGKKNNRFKDSIIKAYRVWVREGAKSFLHNTYQALKVLFRKKHKVDLLEPHSESLNTPLKSHVGNVQETRTDIYVPIAENDVDPLLMEVKPIAFYLPQFHPIPENDSWWGKGFTEWTNVLKASPNFKGHYQPRLPGDLGYYDLRSIDVQKQQVQLAKKYGIYGFCFYYYWFNGQRLLERPVNQFIENPDLDFPFCLCWANENWTRCWDGRQNDILIGQYYDKGWDNKFINDLIPVFRDKRYIRVNGKPLLIIYRVNLLPDPKKTADLWRSECREKGIGEIFLAVTQSFGITDPRPYGFDGAIEFPMHNLGSSEIDQKVLQITNPEFDGKIFDYRIAAKLMITKKNTDYILFKTVTPSWDNTARRQNDGHIFINSTPEAYKDWLKNIIKSTKQNFSENNRFIFINAWNEWAEGNYLEPDQKYGYAYLASTAEALAAYQKKSTIP
jgi:lipopolysaccharide biosynthesis protein